MDSASHTVKYTLTQGKDANCFYKEKKDAIYKYNN